MRLINAGALEKDIVAKRNEIPETIPAAVYELTAQKPNRDGQLIRAGMRKALECLNNAPTVDAVPVVRCEHCKHSWFNGVSLWLCQRESNFYCPTVKADDFCSYGERKEE